MLSERAAHADLPTSRLNWNWERFLDIVRDPQSLLSAFQPRESPNTEAPVRGLEQPDGIRALSPHVSIIARDWGGAQILFGHMGVSDHIRLSRSSRMVLSRVRFGDGRIVPFTHFGLGQWRTDTDLFPMLPHDMELAARLGGGMEIRVFPRAVLALEVDHTMLMRDTNEPQHMAPHLWASFIGLRGSL